MSGMEGSLNRPLKEVLALMQQRIMTRSTYFGIATFKSPLDFWVYQELLYETRPDVIVEIGNFHGGSTLALAHLCDALGNGIVIGVDLSHDLRNAFMREGGADDDSVAEGVAQMRQGESAAAVEVADLHDDVGPGLVQELLIDPEIEGTLEGGDAEVGRPRHDALLHQRQDLLERPVQRAFHAAHECLPSPRLRFSMTASPRRSSSAAPHSAVQRRTTP